MAPEEILVDTYRPYFDFGHYCSQFGPEVGFDTVEEAILHFLAFGQSELRSPHPLVDLAYYRSIHPDLAEVPDLFGHYLAQGQFEARRPHPLFDPDTYVDRHVESCSDFVVGSAPFSHFITCDVFTSPSLLWLPPAEEVPADCHGARQRDYFLAYLRGELSTKTIPHPLFDPAWYEAFSTQDGGKTPPLVHYASRTGNERTLVRCHALIDEPWLLSQHGNEIAWWQSPLEFVIRNPELPTAPGVNQDAFRMATGRAFDTCVAAERKWSATDADERREFETDVSVLIINIDALPMTVACVEALRESNGSLAFEVIVLDNCSSDPQEVTRLSALLDGVTVLGARHRYSFGEANNLMAEHAGGDLLLLLNNDAVISPQSIRQLRSNLIADESLVSVGPLFVYPNGTIQEAGGRVVEDGTPIQIAKGFAVLPDALKLVRDVDYVSAACALIRRSAFHAVSGFSPVFEPAYFEDTDLFRRLSEVGRIQIHPEIRVPHFEGYTTGRQGVLADKPATIHVARRKWLTRFQTEPQSPERCKSPMATHQGATQTVLFSPYGLMVGGGERYLLSMAQSFHTWSNVSLAFPYLNSRFRLAHVQHELGLEQIQHELVDEVQLRAGLAPDVFVCMGNHLRPPMQGIGRRNIYHLQFPFPEEGVMALSTRRLLDTYDLIVVNSEFTRRWTTLHLRQVGCHVPVVIVNPPCGSPTGAAAKGRQRTVVSLGRFFAGGHSKQHRAMISAAESLLERTPDARVILAGAIAGDPASLQYFDELTASVGNLPIELLASPTRGQVNQLLDDASVYWHAAGLGVPASEPHRMEHFGIAIVEAAFRGAVPLAYDEGGPLEILAGAPELLYGSVDDLVGKTVELLESNEERQQRLDALSQLEAFSDEAFHSALTTLVTDVLGKAGDGGSPR